MNKVETPLFKEFAYKHFGPKEQVVYLLQVARVLEERIPGKVQKVLGTQDGEACLTYYYYDEMEEAIYVLAAHLIRKGEPGTSEIEAVEEYIRQIKAGLL